MRVWLLLLAVLLIVPVAADEIRHLANVEITFRTSPPDLEVCKFEDGQVKPLPTHGGRAHIGDFNGVISICFRVPGYSDWKSDIFPVKATDAAVSSHYWPSRDSVQTVDLGEKGQRYYGAYQRQALLRAWGVPIALGLAGLVLLGYAFNVRVWQPRKQRLEVDKNRDRVLGTIEIERQEKRDLNIGRQFGAYQTVTLLGEGGMAKVYRALPTETLDTKHPVAIKLMNESAAPADEHRKRFFREADVGRQLSHPAVVRIEDYGDSDGTLYLTMEFIEGKTVRAWIRPEGLSGQEVWKVLRPVLEGMHYVHERGVIHRDLKPENIMVTYTGRTVIMDFGLARRHDHSMLTGSGDILGTPAYMSPEQIQGTPPTDARTDQYAIGVLAYELITGKMPFPETTDPIQLLMKNISEKPTPARELRPDVSPELEGALLKMLEKNPNERFESLWACRAALEPLIAGLGMPLILGGPQEQSQSLG